jgi:type II secretory pathway pseudopilin PulG
MKSTRMKEGMRNHLQIAKRRGHCESGFTLLETAIAFSIMLIVAMATTALFLYANGYNSGASDRALAISVAKQQMEQLRNVQFDDTLLSVTSSASTSTVSNGGKNYTVSKTVENMTACSGCNAARKITITVTPQDSNPLWGAAPVSIVTIRSDSTSGPYSK